MGIKIKTWGFLFGFEFFEFPVNMMPHSGGAEIFLWVILLCSHMAVFSLPFIVRKNYFRAVLISAPLIFVGAYSLLNPGFLLLLIPFIVLWFIAIGLSTDIKYPVK